MMSRLYYLRALCLFMLGRKSESLAWCIRFRDAEPDTYQSWAMVWECYYATGSPGSALHAAQEAVEKLPEIPELHLRLACSWASFDRLDFAEKEAREAVRLSGENSQRALKILGRIASLQGKWDDSFKLFSQANKDNGADYDLALRIAFLIATCPDAEFRKEKTSDATTLCRFISSGVSHETFDARIFLIHACAAANADDFDAALEQLDKFQKRQDTDDKLRKQAEHLRALFEAKTPYRLADDYKTRVFDLPVFEEVNDPQLLRWAKW